MTWHPNGPPRDVLDLTDPDFHLVWPRDLFINEAQAVLGRTDNGAGWSGKLLIEEAFAGSAAVDAFDEAPFDGRAVLAELLRRAPQLRDHRTDRAPYLIERSRRATSPAIPNWSMAQRRFTYTARELNEKGYFDRAWGRDCVDDARDPGREEDAIEEALGIPDLNPLQPHDDWDHEVFLSVIEVLHDVVARPRSVERVHNFSDCGRHYEDFARAPGQAVFRLEVNKVLASARVPYRLAGDGEDLGRVVTFSDDAREELAQTVIESGRVDERDELTHAIALFRARGADREAKRAAVFSLARILEQHRAVLRTDLLNGDEQALFRIANQFDVRHRDGNQRTDYDPAFLDWIFWWYLATIDLLTHLLDE